ncbi:flavodoxin reductase [Lutimaribacter marinistellae]|uniref:Flavodoxin reductase n=1 Tax=Lutimaribacter marinistellae TaxID=1820329 RepID=A0ABV7TML9_9RHOB
MTHKITLQAVVPLTHDTRHYVFTRPNDFAFSPGQATEMELDREGWRDEGRPFTFTGDPKANVLTFTIKSYFDHDGVTKQLWGLQPGDHVLIGDAWGAIEDRGPGIFIAGGAGITPFIDILTQRHRDGGLKGSTLIFSNKTEEDIILKPLWEDMEGLATHYLLSDPKSGGEGQKPDGPTLDRIIGDWDQRFYVCGPPPMEESVIDHLKSRGVTDDQIIHEE